MNNYIDWYIAALEARSYSRMHGCSLYIYSYVAMISNVQYTENIYRYFNNFMYIVVGSISVPKF